MKHKTGIFCRLIFIHFCLIFPSSYIARPSNRPFSLTTANYFNDYVSSVLVVSHKFEDGSLQFIDHENEGSSKVSTDNSKRKITKPIKNTNSDEASDGSDNFDSSPVDNVEGSVSGVCAITTSDNATNVNKRNYNDKKESVFKNKQGAALGRYISGDRHRQKRAQERINFAKCDRNVRTDPGHYSHSSGDTVENQITSNKYLLLQRTGNSDIHLALESSSPLSRTHVKTSLQPFKKSMMNNYQDNGIFYDEFDSFFSTSTILSLNTSQTPSFKDDSLVPTMFQSILNSPRHKFTAVTSLARGSYGEVWRAISLQTDAKHVNVVLKRILNAASRSRNTDGSALFGATGESHFDNKHKMSDHQNVEMSRRAFNSGLREIYFGTLLEEIENISRFIEYFEVLRSPDSDQIHSAFGNQRQSEFDFDNNTNEDSEFINEPEKFMTSELWLVSADEGMNLGKLFFQPDEFHGGLVTPTKYWYSMKNDDQLKILKSIIFQILNGLRSAHCNFIVHRDIKLENIFVAIDPHGQALNLRIGDWGSAIEYERNYPSSGLHGDSSSSSAESPKSGRSWPYVSKETVDDVENECDLTFDKLVPSITSRLLYGANGPSEQEETELYTPPESMFETATDTSKWRSFSYDIWSIGILFLQLVLGDINVMKIHSDRKQSKLERFLLKDVKPEDIQRELYFEALAELCLASHVTDRYLNKTANTSNEQFHSNEHLKSKCSDHQFEMVLESADLTKKGLPDADARDLMRRLLSLYPEERPTAEEALRHPWLRQT